MTGSGRILAQTVMLPDLRGKHLPGSEEIKEFDQLLAFQSRYKGSEDVLCYSLCLRTSQSSNGIHSWEPRNACGKL